VSSFDLAMLAGQGPSPDEQEGLTIRGTPRYLAPEQAMGRVRAIGPATDVHGLGAIIYELLTGRPPFTATDPVDWVRQVATMRPVSPRQLEPSVPAMMEDICLRCLEKDPTRRYPGADALADDLDLFLAGRRRLAPEAKLGRRLREWLNFWKKKLTMRQSHSGDPNS